jgi:predicted transglutaminase-like cysteine proteinase
MGFRLRPLVFALGVFAASVSAAAAQGGGLLGTLEFPSDDLRALPQWTRVLDKMAGERAVIAQCDADAGACSGPKFIAWRAKIGELQTREPLDRLWEVNRFVNTWSKKADQANYGTAEYWASTLEFLDRSGDSEDFAIMKFFMLRELGFDNDRLRIVTATDVLSSRVHTFLVAILDGQTYVLDNLSDTVLTQEHSGYYVPSYSVNETTRWAHVARHVPPATPAGGD